MRSIRRYGIYNCLQPEFPFDQNTGYRAFVHASKFSSTMSESGKGGEPAWSNDTSKMIKALKESGLYETGMDLKEMQQLLAAVQASQRSAQGGGGNNNFNKSPELMRQDNQPCHSRGFNSKNSERGSMSPDLSGSQTRKSLSQEKRGESGDELMYSQHGRGSFGKENKDVPPANMNKSRLSMGEHFSESMDNNKIVQRTKSLMRNHEVPTKHMVNPLDVVFNINDVRLQPIYRTPPEKDCAEDGNCVNIDEALPRLMKHLQQTAILWHSQQRSSGRSKIPWGKAIQVDTDNASEDKESVSDTTWPIAGPSGTNSNVNNDRRRRTCARKIIDYAAAELSGSNSDNDFEETSTSTSEKRKSTKRASSSEKTNPQKDSVETTRKRRNTVKKDDIYVWNEEQMSEKEEEQQDEEKKNVKRKKFTEEASSSQNTNLAEENVTSDSTGRRRTVPEKVDDFRWETIMDEDDDDDDSDEESKKITKKKKPTKSRAPPKKVTTTRTRRQKSVEPSTSHEAERENDDAPVCIEDSDEITIFDSEASGSLPKIQKSRSEEAVSSSTSSFYPRRIVPPNPKGKYAGITARKPLLNFCNRTREGKQSEPHERVNEEDARDNRQERNRSGLSQSEIADVLDTDDEKQVIPVPRDFEIKPMRVSGRMKMQQEHLRNLRKQEEQREFQRAEELRIKEETARREKEEKIRQRLKEENAKLRVKEQEAKAKAELERLWHSRLNQQGKKRQTERTELNPEGPRQNNDSPTVLMENNHFETSQQIDVEVVDDDRRGGGQRVPCPICGKKFMAKQIEDHAAACEEYDATTTPDASRSSSPVVSARPATSMRRGISEKLYECHVCSAYSSYDGRKFEDHVNKCVARHRDGVAAGPSAVVEVPDSPIRNLRKASELTDSEINYKDQFARKTKSQLNDNRKRKRL